ncbi:MAG: hypothetical protein RR712_01065 [Terrisporobacter sp.]|uniref:hypothetical protein n=1 Tax=Terrisporobacter sp. TaxID=1965305 RepID=UPI002FCABE4C
MKKSGILMILISIIFLFCVNEYYRYDGYQEIDIPDIGVVRVPEDWYCSKTEDGLVYFANMPIDKKGCKVYFVQYSVSDNSSKINTNSQWENYYLGNILSLENIKISENGDSNAYSNGSSYIGCSFYLNEIKVDSYYVKFKGREKSSIFFVVDDSIDMKTLEDMTQWFKMY